MKKVISILLVTLTTIFTGCISPNTNGIQATTAQTDATKNSTTQDNIKKSDDKVETANPKNDNVVKKYDFFNDYKSEIESEVENATAKASSLQDEINQVQKIANSLAISIFYSVPDFPDKINDFVIFTQLYPHLYSLKYQLLNL